jgi:hypothetical protein
MSLFIHTHSVRTAQGAEVLVTRAVAPDGRIGFGYSLTLDSTASRHMAEALGGEAQLPEEIRELAKSIRWLGG